ncbi:hypothetical protein HPB50_009570 [Hyalomma asiaticum]|uniref:Uncharacterized protein n=1 Tax=Hyalomma asiaticum TaxID=266040 RepID=A0ACB7RN84_HYAAI|nr:hypothetical protein HPB50_009570 [Hyalomma asiaticum]
MPAMVEVEGMDTSPEELEDAGWTVAFRSRKGDVRKGSSGGGGQRGGVKAPAGSGKVQEAVRRGLRPQLQGSLPSSALGAESARTHSPGGAPGRQLVRMRLGSGLRDLTSIPRGWIKPRMPGPPERRGRSPDKTTRDLAELKAAFESFKERAQGDRKEPGPLWGKAKRRALDPAEGQSESTAAVVAVQLEAAPSSVAGGVEDRWAHMETTLSRMMDVLSSLEGRREARARAILRSVGSDAKAALFVDAAEYSTRRAFGVSVVDGKGQLVARASVCTDQVTAVEEIAIALALQAAEVPCVVYSDSRSAVWAFSGGLISQQAAWLLRSGRRQARWAGGHHISWFPAHVEGIDGVNPNASAHTLARECMNRAGGGEASGGNIDLRKDPLTTFHEITSSYKLSMRRFLLPNARLNRAQGITFRLLQMDTYLCPRTYRRIAPDFQEEGPRCGLESCSLTRMLWQCPANVGADLSDEDSNQCLHGPYRAIFMCSWNDVETKQASSLTWFMTYVSSMTCSCRRTGHTRCKYDRDQITAACREHCKARLGPTDIVPPDVPLISSAVASDLQRSSCGGIPDSQPSITCGRRYFDAPRRVHTHTASLRLKVALGLTAHRLLAEQPSTSHGGFSDQWQDISGIGYSNREAKHVARRLFGNAARHFAQTPLPNTARVDLDPAIAQIAHFADK